ncbi:hypothetical protein [Chryseobacterium tagetis]|uniref:hypothetical protein n=1 Tax=Chryseobacterium tagetis TaxID=2801334 RepID=UPI001CE35D7B|nr:hypothetical protein [Chryseobacterium tagetis]
MKSVIGPFSNSLKHHVTVNLINYSYGKYADSMISATKVLVMSDNVLRFDLLV